MYIGTLHTSCTSKKVFLGSRLEKCTDPEVLNERDDAVAVMQEALQLQGSFLHVPLIPKGQPSVELRREDILPMGVLSGSMKKMEQIPWIQRGIGLGTGGIEMVGQAFKAGQGGMLYFLYLPFGILGGTISGAAKAGRWDPCLKELEIEALSCNHSETIAADFMTSMPDAEKDKISFLDGGADTGMILPAPKTISQLELLRLGLTECSNRGKFCLDMAVRLRLWDVTSGIPLYDSVMYSSNLIRTE